MLFRCDGLDLSEAVNKVLKAVSSKTVSPILEGIKISAIGNNVVLAGTDLELSIQKTIKAEVIDEGETVVPGKLFGEYLRKAEIKCTPEDATLYFVWRLTQMFIFREMLGKQ